MITPTRWTVGRWPTIVEFLLYYYVHTHSQSWAIFFLAWDANSPICCLWSTPLTPTLHFPISLRENWATSHRERGEEEEEEGREGKWPVTRRMKLKFYQNLVHPRSNLHFARLTLGFGKCSSFKVRLILEMGELPTPKWWLTSWQRPPPFLPRLFFQKKVWIFFCPPFSFPHA